MKPFCQACENNKRFILDVLRVIFADRRLVLEIGSGTGQHAAYFAHHLRHLTWQTSDLEENHAGIAAWLAEAGGAKLPAPLPLDVDQADWPIDRVDAAFSANTAHILHWPSVVNMVNGLGRVLVAKGLFALYGPFNYAGVPTSESNAQFDRWLRERDPAMGLRDVEELEAVARDRAMVLIEDHAMPANNRLLVWRKSANPEPRS